MTNIILPRRKLLVPAMAAGLAAASPAMGHNGGPPITDGEVRAAVEDVRRAGIELPWGSLPSDPTLAMFMMAKMAGMMVGGSAEPGLRPQDVFAAITRTDATSVSNGIDFATHGGLLWIKPRTASGSSGDHFLVDTVRGKNNYLSSNTTSGQASDTSILNSFGAVGYNLGFSNNTNFPGVPYIDWSFRRAAKFFDVVTYTGDGTAGRRIPHGLGVVPGIIIGRRADTSQDWWTWHKDSPGLKLNGTDANNPSFAFWAGADASTLSAALNSAGATYVAYLFAHDPDPSGIVQCGSYVGAGASVSTATTGWKPQYVLVKNASATSSWWIADAARGQGYALRADLSDAEFAGPNINFPTFTSTGFQIGASSLLGTSGQTYIYLAIREPI